uniref:Uncharacterized protein n=1 Tax=Glossina palpalis gambiensis TaxID=67801 RepID=A0A1B0B9Z1_9MUSC
MEQLSGVMTTIIIIGDATTLRSPIFNTADSIKRVIIRSAELLEGVPTSRCALGVNLKICKMLSISFAF